MWSVGLAHTTSNPEWFLKREKQSGVCLLADCRCMGLYSAAEEGLVLYGECCISTNLRPRLYSTQDSIVAGACRAMGAINDLFNLCVKKIASNYY